MKITCTVELDVPEEFLAKPVLDFIQLVRAEAEGRFPKWSPKVSCHPIIGVESEQRTSDARDT